MTGRPPPGPAGFVPGDRVTAWRLLRSGCADGATNMAVDEAIAAAVARGDRPPTLRLYGWRPPAVSLGCFQPLDEGIDLAAINARGWALVRRPTGGRAILHADELTYSVCVRQDDIRGGHSTMESYREISRGIIAGLERLGGQVALGDGVGARSSAPAEGAARPICFAKTARCDLQAQGRKVVGSAQMRRDGGILQHGSIPITIDLAEQTAVMPGGDRRVALRVLAGAAMSVSELLGRPVSYEELADAVVRGFAEALGVDLREEALSAEERAVAARLRAEKYATREWTQRPGMHNRESTMADG